MQNRQRAMSVRSLELTRPHSGDFLGYSEITGLALFVAFLSLAWLPTNSIAQNDDSFFDRSQINRSYFEVSSPTPDAEDIQQPLPPPSATPLSDSFALPTSEKALKHQEFEAIKDKPPTGNAFTQRPRRVSEPRDRRPSEIVAGSDPFQNGMADPNNALDLPSSRRMMRNLESTMERLKLQLERDMPNVKQPPLYQQTTPSSDTLHTSDPIDRTPVPYTPSSSPIQNGRAVQNQTTSDATIEYETLSPHLETTTNPVLSVVVRSTPDQHFARVMERLYRAKHDLKVTIGEVVVIGDYSQLLLSHLASPGILSAVAYLVLEKVPSPQPPGSLPSASELGKAFFHELPLGSRAMKGLSLRESGEPADVNALTQRYRLNTSPTWIVHVNGKDHVFPGDYDITELFSPSGEFLGEDL